MQGAKRHIKWNNYLQELGSGRGALQDLKKESNRNMWHLYFGKVILTSRGQRKPKGSEAGGHESDY